MVSSARAGVGERETVAIEGAVLETVSESATGTPASVPSKGVAAQTTTSPPTRAALSAGPVPAGAPLTVRPM